MTARRENSRMCPRRCIFPTPSFPRDIAMLKYVPLLIAGAMASVSSPTLRDAGTTFKVPVVVVHAKDFGYTVLPTIASGLTTFRLVNDGKELHHMTILKLDKGKTLADFQAELKKQGPPPTWLTAVGGPNAAEPGKTVEATLNLEAGNCVSACFISSPGSEIPHMAKGMLQSLTVVSGGVTQAGSAANAWAPTPVPEIHLELKEYGYPFSKPLTAGKHVIHVMNSGTQEHEVIFVRTAPGKHASDIMAWARTGMKGPPPGSPVDGMATLAKGRTGFFTANLTPGTYVLLCFVPDAKDGKI